MLTRCCCILLFLSAGLEGPDRSSEHWSGGTLPPFKRGSTASLVGARQL